MTKKVIRELTVDDLDKLMEIEKNFPNPWPRKAFLLEMKGEFNKSIALEIDGELIAYIFYSEYFDEININHLAVDSKFRNKGYASLIMENLLNKTSENQLIYLEVNTKNLAAIKLYEKFGLEIINIRENYYGKGEDAYIMQKNRKIEDIFNKEWKDN